MTKEETMELLTEAQAYVSEHCALLLTEKTAEAKERIYHAVENFVAEKDSAEKEGSRHSLEEREATVRVLYDEMACYSVLTPYLNRSDVEEIDVNAWNDIMVQYSSGKREKLSKGFLSGNAALDIIKRLLRESGTIMDCTEPLAEGSLSGEKRIAAIQNPILDEEAGVSCSIRLLHPTRRTLEDLIQNGTASEEMMSFLIKCFDARISFVVAGSTDAGKTTLLGALLRKLPEEMRLFAIESGTREFSLVREEEGRIVTNVVHTLSNTDRSGNISQEKLVEAALRFNPDVIVIGEMRDVEACAAVEAAGSGHMVVSTVHANGARGAITRIAMLSKKKYQMDFTTAYQQAAMAFPIVVCVKKDKACQRRVTGIFEVELSESGDVLYKPLFSLTKGKFQKEEEPGETLGRMLQDE